MKHLRVLLLVLLAVLLPIRGAMAVTMRCPPLLNSQGHGHAAAGMHQGHAMGHAHSMPGKHPASHGDAAGHDKCSLCASCCSLVPLVSSFADWPEPFEAAAQFPELSVPALSFVLDGQERPPRSL